MDRYKNFAELFKNEKEGKDYIIRYRNAGPGIAVIAPHGGGIEPGTLDIADEIAGKNFSFYSFSGVKKRGNSVLHIRSTAFDEPVGLKIVRRADTVLSIHGCRNKNAVIYAGGKNNELKKAIAVQLTNAGFNIKNSLGTELKGKSDRNICNRCRSGKGVQLEISQGLRYKMTARGRSVLKEARTDIFYAFVNAVRNALLAVSNG